jgi:hypothetical protein
MSKMQANCRFHIKIQKLHSNCTQSQKENAEKPAFARLFGIVMFIPTRRIKSISKLFCLENIIRGGFV